jgi:hypothetical protein
MKMLILESVAFDLSGRRDKSRDDWKAEDIGYFPHDPKGNVDMAFLKEFSKNRYPHAIAVRAEL